MNLKPFNEDQLSVECSPLDAKEQDFDWDGLFHSLGETTQELQPKDYEAMGQALRSLMTWLVDVDTTKPGATREIARRTLALCWLTNPSILKGSPSLSRIAHDLRCHKVWLSKQCANARRQYGIVNRASAHASNFKAKNN